MPDIKRLSFMDVHPFVRYVQELPISPGEYPVYRRPYDCRFFYVSKGKGRLYIDDQTWELTHGDIVLWQTGVKYHMDAFEDKGMFFLGTNFDFTSDCRSFDYPIPPERSDSFNEREQLEIVHFTDAPEFDRPIHLRGMFEVERMLLDMLVEFKTRKIFWRERINSQMGTLLSEIARKAALLQRESESAEHRFDPVISYIHEHYSEGLDNHRLGEIFKYHPNYLNRKIQLLTGQSLHQYLITYRIQKAIDLLGTTELPLTEIAQMTGFGDVFHFSKIFKQKTGNTPSSYRSPK